MIELILSNYTLRIVLMGTILLGAIAGVIGVFLTLRKQALVGDALSHAALPGIVLAFIITKESSLYMSILGAIVASVISIFLIDVIKRYSIIKSDAILAIVLSSMFGFGQVLLSMIGNTAGQDQSRLKSFIFGQAATMSFEDVIFLMVILGIVFLTVIVFWRHIKLFIFNKDFYQSLGFPGYFINVILNTLTILVVVSGIQSVGVILMSALLIAPSVGARLWSNDLKINVILAATFGAVAGLLGTLYGQNIPTGPVIVIFATSIVIISLLIAPRKGMIWVNVTEKIHQHQIKKFKSLIHIYENNDYDGISTDSIQMLLTHGYLEKRNQEVILSHKGKTKVLQILAGEL